MTTDRSPRTYPPGFFTALLREHDWPPGFVSQIHPESWPTVDRKATATRNREAQLALGNTGSIKGLGSASFGAGFNARENP